MHALVAELTPWLLLLWAVDALVQPRRGHRLVVDDGLRRPRLLGAGLHLAGLSPLDRVTALLDLPFLAGAGRVFLIAPGRRPELAIVDGGDLVEVPAGALSPVTRDGVQVRAGGRLAAVAPTPELAEALRARLEATARGEPSAPDAVADLAAARVIDRRTRRWRVALRALAALLALDLAVGFPVVAWAPLGAALPAETLVAAAGALVLAIAAAGAALAAAAGEGAARSLATGAALLLPWGAVRPLARAGRSAFRGLEPLAVLAALLPAAAFRELAGRELARIAASRERTPPAVAPAWRDRERALEALLVAVGSCRADALAPPPRAVAWCPVCRSEYVAAAVACVDCGVPLSRAA
jgi:hypothetical protein